MVLNAFLRIRLIRAKKDGKPPYRPLYSDVKKEEKEKSRRQQRRLLIPSELPPWYDSNPYILTGYRPVSQSFWTSLKSWTYLHNESCNIYTHLVPGVLFLLAQGTLYRYIIENWNRNQNRNRNLNGNVIGTSTSIQLTGLDWGILSLQLFTASTCLLVSAFYHTLSNHSEHAAHRWLQFDYVGILTLILGNFISGLHFGFYCEPALKYFYWGLILTLSLLTAITLLSPKFRGPQFRSLRLAAFVGTGLSAVAPIGHVWLAWGPNRLEKMGVPYYFLEGALLFIGCYFWERRIPERLFPGKFDIWMHSHTIWHVFVAGSVVAHVCGLLSAVNNTYQSAWCLVR